MDSNCSSCSSVNLIPVSYLLSSRLAVISSPFLNVALLIRFTTQAPPSSEILLQSWKYTETDHFDPDDGTLPNFPVGLKTVAKVIQKVTNGSLANSVPLSSKVFSNLCCALASPSQSRLQGLHGLQVPKPSQGPEAKQVLYPSVSFFLHMACGFA